MRETMRLTRNDASPTAHNPNERVNGHAYPTGARSTHTTVCVDEVAKVLTITTFGNGTTMNTDRVHTKLTRNT